jgi:hypothetical protein
MPPDPYFKTTVRGYQEHKGNIGYQGVHQKSVCVCVNVYIFGEDVGGTEMLSGRLPHSDPVD